MSIVENVTALVLPIIEPFDLSLYDVTFNGGNLSVMINSEGGVDLEAIAEVTRLLSRALDADDPMPGRYTLEVSSPGLERKLRTPEHFAGALGELVSVKLGPHVVGDRRFQGYLVASDAETITVDAGDDSPVEIALSDVTKAMTVFEWGSDEKSPAGGSSRDAATDAEADDPERRAAAR